MKEIEKENLKEYCKEKNIKYSSINARVKNMMKRDLNLTEKEAIEIAIKSYKQVNYTYMVYDVPLKKICEQENLNERNIIHRYIKYYKNRDDISMDDALTEIIDFYKNPPIANTKYFYKNRPVKEICEEKGINYRSVFGTYRKKYRNRDDVSMDEAFEEIFKHFEEKKKELPKYMYKGRPVKEVCEEIGLNSDSVITRYRNKYKDNEMLTMDEAFEEIINHFLNSKKTEKILYKNKAVKKICEENNLNYNKVLNKYRDEYKYRTDITMDDAFEEIFKYYKDNPERVGKYFYKDKSIKEICEENNLNYERVISMYRRRYENRNGVSMDDAFDEIFKYYQDPNAKEKYLYKGVPVRKICEERNLDYEKVLERRRKNYKNRKDLTMDEMFDEIFEYYENPNAKEKYLYKNIPVRQICDEKGIKYRTVIGKYRSEYSNREDISMDDAFDEIFEYYEKVKLRKYCSENDLNYKYIIKKYEEEYQNKKDLSMTDAFLEIIENDPNSKIIYYFGNKPVEEYCFQEGLDYDEVIKLYKMNRTSKQRRTTTMTLAVQEVINNKLLEEKKSPKRKVKYKIGGVPLTEICKEKDVVYGSVIVKYKREYASREDLTEEEKLEAAIKALEDKNKKSINNLKINSKVEELPKQVIVKDKKSGEISTENTIPRDMSRMNRIPFPDVLIDKLEYLFRGKYDGKKYEQPNFKSQKNDKEYKVDDYKLIDYCRLNSINCTDVLKAFKENYEGSRFISESDAFKEIIKQLKSGKTIKSNIKVGVGKDNKEIDFAYVGRVYREKYEGREDISKAQAINEIILEIKEGTYYGKRLEEYCKENNYPYSEMSSRVINLKKRFSKVSNEELLEKAKTEYHNNRKIKVKNELQGQFLFNKDFSHSELMEVCDNLSIDFDTVQKLKCIGFSYFESMSIILCYSDKVDENQYLTLSNQSLEKLKEFKKESIKPKINDIVNSQENIIMQDMNALDEINDETSKMICQKLDISFENVCQLSEIYGEKRAINLIWYLLNQKNLSGKLLLEEVNKINREVLEIKTKDKDEVNEMDTYYLISLYKCNLYDSRENIVSKEEEYFNSIVESLSKKIIVDENTEIVLKNKLQELLLEAIDEININDSSKMLESMDLYIKQGITSYLNNSQIREDNKIRVKTL